MLIVIFYVLFVLSNIAIGGEMDKDKNIVVSSKEKDILEFIKVSLLRPEQMDAMMKSVVIRASVGIDSTTDIDQVITDAKKHILSDVFLKKFVELFVETFSHDEIKELIYFYKSSAMRKFNKSYASTCLQVYAEFDEVVSDLLGVPSHIK